MIGCVYKGKVEYIERIEDFQTLMDSTVYDALLEFIRQQKFYAEKDSSFLLSTIDNLQADLADKEQEIEQAKVTLVNREREIEIYKRTICSLQRACSDRAMKMRRFNPCYQK